MFHTKTHRGKGLKTGLLQVDRLMAIDDGIITIRANSWDWLFYIAANLMVRNSRPDKTILYLHWVDYHDRYWTLDFDLISRIAKRVGADMDSILHNTSFVRCFTRDSTEDEGNWKGIFESSKDVSFAILDSASELFSIKGSRKLSSMNRTYSIGMFGRLCSMNDCIGIVMENSRYPINEFLGELSSIILEFYVGDRITIQVVKHPNMGSFTEEIITRGNHSLARWLK